MKNKIFSLFGFAILALLVLTSFASATITLSATTPANLLQTSGAHTFTFTVTSDVNVTDTIDFSAPTITDPSGNTITFTAIPAASYTLVASTASAPITMTYTVGTDFDFGMKQYTSTLTANGTLDDTQVLTFAQTTDFCTWDDNNLTSTTADLTVSIEDITVKSGFGEDEEWYPQDEVEVEITVENKDNTFDIDNIVLEWGLFNEDSGEWTIEVADENDFSIKDGEENTIILSIKVDDLDEDFEDITSGDFVFYVRATGDVDDDAGEYEACAGDSEPITITFESDFVVLDNIVVPELTTCGGQAQIIADVWNIGESDQEDVYLIIYNKELGINEKVTLGDIDKFDDGKLDTLVKIPSTAEEKTYTVALWVYNDDDEVFQNDNDDESKVDILLKVEGSCSTVPLATITNAGVTSEEIKAGQELVIKATVTNSGTLSKTFAIELSDYADWASLVSIDKTSVTLASKGTAEVTITLNVNKDISGEQSFNLLVKDGTKVLSQPINVEFEDSSILSQLTGLVSGTGSGKTNYYLWGIGALNVVLVLAIIFVAIKALKKSKQ